MEVSEPQAVLREFVDVWCSDLASIAAYIREAQVIGENDEKIWRR